MERIGKTVKIGIIAAAALVLAGVSAYAVSNAGSISEAEAKEIALSYVVGANESNITKCRKGIDDGKEEYDVEIVYGGYEYDFEISAKDGRIVDQSRDKLDTAQAAAPAAGTEAPSAVVTPSATASAASQPTAPANSAASSTTAATATASDIGLEKARSIALSEVSGASSAHIVKAYGEYDDGRLEYDVEIHYNGYEYEFEIDGETGKIWSKDIERLDYYDGRYYD